MSVNRFCFSTLVYTCNDKTVMSRHMFYQDNGRFSSTGLKLDTSLSQWTSLAKVLHIIMEWKVKCFPNQTKYLQAYFLRWIFNRKRAAIWILLSFYSSLRPNKPFGYLVVAFNWGRDNLITWKSIAKKLFAKPVWTNTLRKSKGAGYSGSGI